VPIIAKKRFVDIKLEKVFDIKGVALLLSSACDTQQQFR
jgi:hypothetical protein